MKTSSLLKSLLFTTLYISLLLGSTSALYYFTVLLIDLGETTQKSIGTVLLWVLYLTIGLIALYFLYFVYNFIILFLIKKITERTFVDTKLVLWISDSAVYFIAIYYVYLVWFGNGDKLSTFGIVVSIVSTIVGVHMFRTLDETTKNKIAELKYFDNGILNHEKIFKELRNEL